jgi:hypothetical protein
MPLNGKFVANLDDFLMPMQAVLTAFLFYLCIYFTVGTTRIGDNRDRTDLFGHRCFVFQSVVWHDQAVGATVGEKSWKASFI